jgi:hypothetical protein
MFGKASMTRHLKACWTRHATAEPRKADSRWFHLVVEARYMPEYWLHLQASANVTFGRLDDVLRAIWLECCDHLSAFKLKQKLPRGALPVDLNSMLQELVHRTQTPLSEEGEFGEVPFGKSLGSRLSPSVQFSHEYDFGSTTELALRVAGEYTAPALPGDIKLLARNEPPVILCATCSKPATQLCLECVNDGAGGLCDACAPQHDCGEDMLVPLVNSPRTGVCGYCGPSVEP